MHFVNVWVLLRELPELRAGSKGAAAGALATKLQQYYTDSVDILTLTPELEVIEHLSSRSLFHPYYLPRSERIPRYLELLKSSTSVEVKAQKLSGDISKAQDEKNIGICKAQDEKNIGICTKNLMAIGKAVQAYHNENGDFPEGLSALYPKYLPDASLLLCPTDELGGKPIFSGNAALEMLVSYGYSFYPENRERTLENRAVYGDVIPLARCCHHANHEFECLNLSFSYEVYRSSREWEYTPEDMYETIEKAILALEVGLQQQPDNESFFYIYPMLVRLYIEGGREKDVDGLIDRFKVVMNPKTLQDHLTLSYMLKKANRDEDVLQLFKNLEKQYPQKRSISSRLAEIHEKLGNAELAMEYRKKVRPTLAWVGKPAPDFSATALDGNPISLQQYRGKVVLLDFWAVWSSFCIAEMPNVKNIYDTYKEQGFDIIGVSLDTDETCLRNYLKENDIPWRQIFSGQERQSPLAQQYDIRSIPARWLIDRDGKLISYKSKGAALEQLVAEVVADKSKNQ